MTGEAKNEPTRDPTPPAEMTMPSRSGLRCSYIDQEEGVEDAVERAGDVGDDRAKRQRQEDRVPPHEPKPLEDVLADARRRRFASGRGGSGLRIRTIETAETTYEIASMRIANGAPITCTSAPASPAPPISASDELVASLLLPSTIRSTPMSDGT